MALAPGTLIGAYRIESAIAAGGMGEVYLATDTRLDSRPVAMKFLLRALDSEEARHRFRREVSALSALNQHPHIVTVHEAGAFDGREYLVTEYVDGGDSEHVGPRRETQLAAGGRAAHRGCGCACHRA